MFEHVRVLLFCWACACASGCVSLAATRGQLDLPGDADGNGKVDIWDVRSIQRSATTPHLHVRQPKNADVSQNGIVDEGDAEAVAKKLEGISTLSITIDDVAAKDEPKTHYVGETIVICAIDTFLPKNVRHGTIRIQSAAANYDSGELELARHVDGRSFYCRWRTSGLNPAHDFRVTATLHKQTSTPPPSPPDLQDNPANDALLSQDTPNSALSAKAPVPADIEPSQVATEEETTAFTHSLEMTLGARDCEPLLLDTTTDVSLPFWDIGLHLTRLYLHDPYGDPVTSVFGRGWTHKYGLALREDTDGSISIIGSETSLGPFRRTSEGRYDPPVGFHARLTRDSDGSFYLQLGSGDTWRFNHDLLAEAIVDAQGHRVSMEHDDDGQLTSVEDESGQYLKFLYDDAGRCAGLQDSTGRFITYQYNDTDDLASVTTADGRQKQYSYDDDHHLTEIDWGSEWKRFAYDKEGRLQSIRTSAGALVKITYDRSPTGETIRMISDESGCQEAQRISCDGLVEVRVLGSEANIALHRDDQQRLVGIRRGSESWKLERDEFNRVTSLPGRETQWQVAYRAAGGGPTSVKDGNGIETRVRYLDSGQPTHLQYPDGTVETRYYAKVKDQLAVKRVLRNGQFIIYRYDNRGLLLQKRLPDKSLWTYAYDKLGNLISAQNAWGRLQFKYQGPQLVEAIYPGNRRYVYKYDDRDRLIQLTNPDGEVLKFGHSPAGEIESIHDGHNRKLAEYVENANRELVERRVGPVATKFSYTDGKLHALKHHADGSSSLITRTFQAEGQQVRIIEPTGASRYQYDSADQVVRADYADGSHDVFEYDQAGNRLRHVHDDVTIEYSPNVLNQYSAINGQIRRHDLNGNLNMEDGPIGRVTYEYDAECRLLRVRLPGPRIIQYDYDPLGRLATRHEGNKVQTFLWDRDQVELVQNEAGVTQQRFVWGREPGELVAIQQANRYTYSLMDQCGNVEALADDQGKFVAQWQYTAFGELVTRPQTQPGPFAFAGAFFDTATNLCLINNRWYSPSTGSFLQPQFSLYGNAYAVARHDACQVPQYTLVAGFAGDLERDALVCPRNGLPSTTAKTMGLSSNAFNVQALQQLNLLQATLRWQPFSTSWQSPQGISP